MSLSLEDAARLGGSDMAGLLGLSPWSTPLSIYARVVAALEGRHLKQADNAPMRRGRHLEAAVLRLYAEETGATVEESVRLVHSQRPYARASLDGVALRDRLYRVVEVKTAGRGEARQWGESGTDQIPQSYLFQCSWYAGVARASLQVEDVVDVAALVAGDLAVYHVPFDAELYEMLLAAAERFWVDHVLPRKPPPVTEPLRDADAVAAIYPQHRGEARDWSELATKEQVAVREWLIARQERVEAQLREKKWEARVRLALATTPSLKGLPSHTGIRRVDWKQNKPSAVTDWEAVAGDVASRANLPASDWQGIINRNTTMKEGARPLKAYAIKEEE